MTEFLVDDLYVRLGGQFCLQTIAIPMGTNCSPLLADLFLYSYENELARLIKVAVGPKRSTNRNLKEIIAIECRKTVIFQLLRPLDISKLAKRELIQCFIIKLIYF